MFLPSCALISGPVRIIGDGPSRNRGHGQTPPRQPYVTPVEGATPVGQAAARRRRSEVLIADVVEVDRLAAGGQHTFMQFQIVGQEHRRVIRVFEDRGVSQPQLQKLVAIDHDTGGDVGLRGSPSHTFSPSARRHGGTHVRPNGSRLTTNMTSRMPLWPFADQPQAHPRIVRDLPLPSEQTHGVGSVATKSLTSFASCSWVIRSGTGIRPPVVASASNRRNENFPPPCAASCTS